MNRVNAVPNWALPRPVLQAFGMAVLMVLVALLSQVGKPVHKLAEKRGKFDLEQVIPERFGDWRLLRTGGVVLPDPSVVANIERVYTQTLSRAYVNSLGSVVMLSIAYGDDQRAAMAVHYPEVCYPAQGFQVRSNRRDILITSHGALPVRRLETELSRQRFEPVTYWVTIGDRISLGGLERRLIELEYGLQRIIPDGLLFRVSSINRDTIQAFRDQDAFTRDLLAAMPVSSRNWVAGDPARAAAQLQP